MTSAVKNPDTIPIRTKPLGVHFDYARCRWTQCTNVAAGRAGLKKELPCLKLVLPCTEIAQHMRTPRTIGSWPLAARLSAAGLRERLCRADFQSLDADNVHGSARSGSHGIPIDHVEIRCADLLKLS
jgi:hypothetical protein